MADVTIRSWEERDRGPLLHMVLHCLEINFNAGADMQPTPKNAGALVDLGLVRSVAGDPCLVASKNGGLIGYNSWVELPNPLGLDFRGRHLTGLGTYVMPSFQNQGVSRALRNEAERRAAALGFTKVIGTAYHNAGLQSVLTRGYRAVGVLVEKTL